MTEVVDESSDVFVQAIFDLESPRLMFGRVLVMGDAAFTVRPYLAAG